MSQSFDEAEVIASVVLCMTSAFIYKNILVVTVAPDDLRYEAALRHPP